MAYLSTCVLSYSVRQIQPRLIENPKCGKSWIFYSHSLRKTPSGLKFGAGFPVWAVPHPLFVQVGVSRIRARFFGARKTKPERRFRSERGRKNSFPPEQADNRRCGTQTIAAGQFCGIRPRSKSGDIAILTTCDRNVASLRLIAALHYHAEPQDVILPWPRLAPEMRWRLA